MFVPTTTLSDQPMLTYILYIAVVNEAELINNFKGDVVNASDILCNRYLECHHISSIYEWSPYNPEPYNPLTIIYHMGRCTVSQVVTFTQEIKTPSGTLFYPDFSSIHKETASINEIFAPFDGTTLFPYMILIEGVSGIGKTVLSKEIAFQWAKKAILKNKKLMFLLLMQDPQVKNLPDVQSLVKYFFQDENLTKKVTKWLKVTDGEHLTIILDGYDEMSKESKVCSIVDGIIDRKQLPKCGIVITSHPASSLHLHNIVDCRAEILGFTKQIRQSLIQNTLVNQNDKIKELTDYLTNNPSLNALCYTPLNISILLWLTEDGISTLPKTQTILYQKFIIMMIIHFLKKDKVTFMTTISSLDDFPPPYDRMIEELSQFAFLSLQKDQLVFTLAEVKAKCPNLTPVNCFGLGLLKPVRYFKSHDACNHESFHFLHYSVQEYMAAYYIASLKNNELLSLLRETFWNIRFFNTWIMYVGITGGKHFTFTHFIAGYSYSYYYFYLSSWLFGSKIPETILNDKIKCLHLLRCSVEADCEMFLSIENIFPKQIIDLSNSNLSVNDVCTLATSLLQLPNKKWEKLNLSGCNINDKSCDILYEVFISKSQSCKIKTVDLSNNYVQWESLCKLCQVFKLWNTEELVISFDTLYDKATINIINDFESKLYQSLHTQFANKRTPCRILSCKYIEKHNTIVAVCSQLIHVVRYKQQSVGSSQLIFGIPTVITCHQLSNCCLDHVTISLLKNLTENVLRFTGIDQINFSYRFDSNVISEKSATLSHYCKKVTFCRSYVHSKGTHMINVPSSSLFDFDYSMFNQNAVDLAIAFLTDTICHNIQSSSHYRTAVNFSLNFIPNLYFVSLNLKCKNISKEAADYIAAVLCMNNNLEILDLSSNNLGTVGIRKIMKGLQSTSCLTALNIACNNISEEAADDIAAVLSLNTKLQKLFIYDNNLQALGAVKIAKGLQNTSSLTALLISKNNISEEAADDIATIISHNIDLKMLELDHNYFGTLGVRKLVNALQSTSCLTTLNIGCNNITEEAADDIAAVLCRNNKLEVLDLSSNNLGTVGIRKIMKGLQSTSCLTALNIGCNKISEEAADDIAAVLSLNTKLKKLFIYENNLQSLGAMKIAKGLQNTSSLTTLVISNNNINEEAADDIATVLSHNINLKILVLGNNYFGTVGFKKILKALQSILCLTTLSIVKSNISEEAADDIATMLCKNDKLKILNLYANDLGTVGIKIIMQGLQNTLYLTTLNIGCNNITEEAADDIAAVLCRNNKLEVLDLSSNNLGTVGIRKIMKGLQSTSCLTALNIGCNKISEEAADDIAAVLCRNNELEILDLSSNNL